MKFKFAHAKSTQPIIKSGTAIYSGAIAETMALEFLLDQGLQLICRNFQSPVGEIDLIMIDGDELVFIEVRLRSNSNFADPIESVDLNKIKRIQNSAELFLDQNTNYQTLNYRFDLIGIQDLNNYDSVEWIENAIC